MVACQRHARKRIPESDALWSHLQHAANNPRIINRLQKLGPDGFASELNDFGEDVNTLFARRNSALSWACEMDSIEYVNVVLAHPYFNILAPGNQRAFGVILRYDRELHLRILLHGPVSHNGGASLNLGRLVAECATQGAKKCLRYLLHDLHVVPTFTTRKGTTALMAACCGGYLDCVKLLLGVRGVDVNACDNAGHTALMFASAACHAAVVAYLVSRVDVDVSKTDAKGLFAASFAVNRSDDKCASLLVGRTSTSLLLRLHRDPTVKRELDRRRRWHARSAMIQLFVMASKHGPGRARPAYDDLGRRCTYVVLRKRVKREIA